MWARGTYPTLKFGLYFGGGSKGLFAFCGSVSSWSCCICGSWCYWGFRVVASAGLVMLGDVMFADMKNVFVRGGRGFLADG